MTVANLGYDANAAVTLRFFPNDGDGSGSLATGWQQNVLISVGAVYQITLSDYVPEGWTGNVHILSDDLIGAIADRYKVGTDMWLTNIGSLSTFEVGDFSYGPVQGDSADGGFYYPFAGQYVLFAPTVFMDYNGWNTGFSVSNLVETDNNVNIQYVHNGNAIQVVTQRLAPHGMLTAYRPSQPDQDQNQQNPMYDQVAGALILSDYPVAAAVDAVKYFGNDNNVGQAMTYNATANLATAQAFPLVQKGNPATGMGATSGLSLLNPLPIQNSMWVLWLNQSGYNASNFGSSMIIVPAQSIGIAYTMTQHNLPNGYYGSAVVHANLPFVATTSNVDYQVQGDGSVIWNGYSPCGLFRSIDFTGDRPATASSDADAGRRRASQLVATGHQGRRAARSHDLTDEALEGPPGNRGSFLRQGWGTGDGGRGRRWPFVILSVPTSVMCPVLWCDSHPGRLSC